MWTKRMGLTPHLPDILMPVCYGGMYAVSAEQINALPRDVFRRIESSLSRGDNVVEGHYAERTWAGLLSRPLPSHHVRQIVSSAASLLLQRGSVYGALLEVEPEDVAAERELCSWAYAEWNQFSQDARAAARTLGYTERAWDDELDLEVFKSEWEELPHKMREAVEFLGMEDYFDSHPDALSDDEEDDDDSFGEEDMEF